MSTPMEAEATTLWDWVKVGASVTVVSTVGGETGSVRDGVIGRILDRDIVILTKDGTAEITRFRRDQRHASWSMEGVAELYSRTTGDTAVLRYETMYPSTSPRLVPIRAEVDLRKARGNLTKARFTVDTVAGRHQVDHKEYAARLRAEARAAERLARLLDAYHE